jgi:hypothetical protein
MIRPKEEMTVEEETKVEELFGVKDLPKEKTISEMEIEKQKSIKIKKKELPEEVVKTESKIKILSKPKPTEEVLLLQKTEEKMIRPKGEITIEEETKVEELFGLGEIPKDKCVSEMETEKQKSIRIKKKEILEEVAKPESKIKIVSKPKRTEEELLLQKPGEEIIRPKEEMIIEEEKKVEELFDVEDLPKEKTISEMEIEKQKSIRIKKKELPEEVVEPESKIKIISKPITTEEEILLQKPEEKMIRPKEEMTVEEETKVEELFGV